MCSKTLNIMVIESRGVFLALIDGREICSRLGNDISVCDALLQDAIDKLNYKKDVDYIIRKSSTDNGDAITFLTVAAAFGFARWHGGEQLQSVEEFLQDCETEYFPSMLGALAENPPSSGKLH